MGDGGRQQLAQQAGVGSRRRELVRAGLEESRDLGAVRRVGEVEATRAREGVAMAMEKIELGFEIADWGEHEGHGRLCGCEDRIARGARDYGARSQASDARERAARAFVSMDDP